MTQPPEYVTRITAPGIHNEPPQSFQLTQLTQDQIRVAREKTWTSILQIVIQGLTGVYIPGGGTSGAENQLSDWAESVQDVPIVGDILEILTGVPDADTNDLGTWVLNFFNNPLGTLFPSAVPQLPSTRIDSSAGGSGNLWDDLTNTWNNFWNGIFGTSATGITPDDVGTAANAVATTANNAQVSTETLSSFWNTPRLLPPWMGASADDVTFDVDRIDGTSTPSLGTMVLIPVKVTQDRIYDAIKFGMSATTMTNLYVALYDADETTGDLTKVLDLGDCKSQLNTAFNQQTIDIPDPIGVQRGELYYIAVLQVGGTASAMHRSSLTTNFTTGLYPKFRGNAHTLGGWTVFPSTIDVADVVSGTRFWGALGTAVEPVTTGAISLSDSFNRSNASTLGPSWTSRSNTVGISSNKPIRTAGGGVSFNVARATHNTRLSSVSQQVSCTSIGTNYKGLTLRGNGSGAFIEVKIQYGGTAPTRYIQINQHSSYSVDGSATNRAQLLLTTSSDATGTFLAEAIGNTYNVYRNGTLKLQWVDSGGAFFAGSNNTEVGITVMNVAELDDWTAQDL